MTGGGGLVAAAPVTNGPIDIKLNVWSHAKRHFYWYDVIWQVRETAVHVTDDENISRRLQYKYFHGKMEALLRQVWSLSEWNWYISSVTGRHQWRRNVSQWDGSVTQQLFTIFGEMTHADNRVTPIHFGSNLAHIHIWIRINPKIRIWILDQILTLSKFVAILVLLFINNLRH